MARAHRLLVALLHAGHLLAVLAQLGLRLHVLLVVGGRLGLVDDVQKVDLFVVQAADEVFCSARTMVLYFDAKRVRAC